MPPKNRPMVHPDQIDLGTMEEHGDALLFGDLADWLEEIGVSLPDDPQEPIQSGARSVIVWAQLDYDLGDEAPEEDPWFGQGPVRLIPLHLEQPHILSDTFPSRQTVVGFTKPIKAVGEEGFAHKSTKISPSKVLLLPVDTEPRQHPYPAWGDEATHPIQGEEARYFGSLYEWLVEMRFRGRPRRAHHVGPHRVVVRLVDEGGMVHLLPVNDHVQSYGWRRSFPGVEEGVVGLEDGGRFFPYWRARP